MADDLKLTDAERFALVHLQCSRETVHGLRLLNLVSASFKVKGKKTVVRLRLTDDGLSARKKVMAEYEAENRAMLRGFQTA